MNNKKIICLFLLLLLFFINARKEKINFMATTKWAAGIAEVAGIENIVCLAPGNSIHPNEYELKPNDIDYLVRAKVIFYSGFEVKMVERMKQALDNYQFKMYQVKTENSLENIKEQALKIAKDFRTVEKYNKNIIELEKVFDDFKKVIKEKKLDEKETFAHIFQVPLAKSLGLKISAVFGPEILKTDVILAASKIKPVLIIDNYHKQVGQPLVEVSKKSVYVSFLNFPGLFGTRSIKDVVIYNMKQIEKNYK
jgi:zinc transport system substrate-binding protein